MTDDLTFPDRMGPIDAMFWTLERDRRLRSTAIAISILDRAPARADLRAVVERACGRIPRLRQRVIEIPGGIFTPVWREDADFSIEDHLSFVVAPTGSDWSFVLDLAAQMVTRAFDRDRPLWEFVLVEGLDGGQAALVQKLHHSIGDGAAGVALMEVLYESPDGLRSIAPPLPAETAGEENRGPLDLLFEATRESIRTLPSSLASSFDALVAAVQRPAETARYASDEFRAVTGIMVSGPGPWSPIMRARSSRSVFAALTLPERALREAGEAHAGTLSDAFLAALGAGLGRYHARYERPVDALRAAIPISVRNATDGATVGNRLSIGQFPLKCGTAAVGDRIRGIRTEVRALKAPASLAAFEALARLVNASPTDLILPLILEEMLKNDIVATSLPGPAAPLQLAGSRVETLLAFGPTAGAAVNVTLMSHLGEATAAFTIDPAAVPDPGTFLESMEAGFAEILGGGSNQPRDTRDAEARG
jgi:diacylglycerol O-acyltransferase